MWTLISYNHDDLKNEDTLILSCSDDEISRALWNHSFRIEFVVTFSLTSLQFHFKVTNTGQEPFSFGTCFHPYFRTADVRNISINIANTLIRWTGGK